MSNETFAAKFKRYEEQIPRIFHEGSDAEVAQISKNIDKLGELVSSLRKVHDNNFDLIALGNQPKRGDSVKRMRKIGTNAVPVVAEIVVKNDPLAGEF